MRMLLHWIVSALAVWITSRLVPGFYVHGATAVDEERIDLVVQLTAHRDRLPGLRAPQGTDLDGPLPDARPLDPLDRERTEAVGDKSDRLFYNPSIVF